MSQVRRAVDLVLLDLDGTTLTPDLAITVQTREAVADCRSLGVLVALASGRPKSSVLAIAHELGGADFAVSLNGATGLDLGTGESWTSRERMTKENLEAALELAARFDLGICLYAAEGWAAAGAWHWVALEESRSGTRPGWRLETSEVLPWSANHPCLKILLVGEPNQARATFDSLREHNSLPGLHMTYPEYVEASPLGISKPTFMRHLARTRDLARDRMLAIGDGANDVPLFAAVGQSVCVANADRSLIAIANWLAPSNASGGVALALQALVLGERASLELLVRQR